MSAIAVASGCGGGSSGPSSSAGSASTTASPAALSSTVHDALARRMALVAAFPGERPGPKPAYQTLEEFGAQDPNPADAVQFRSEGLQAVASQHLSVPGTDDAVQTVFVFATANGAQDDLRQELKASPGTTLSRFAVSTIPGAVGTEPQQGGVVVGRNVLFVVGPYEYVVGVAPTAGAKAAPSRRAIAAVATAWYMKVKGLS